MRAVSRLTSKSQTTIPRAVREKLLLRPGDVIVYEIEGGEVRLRKGSPLDVSYLRALQTTLTEWDSPEPTMIGERIDLVA